MGLHWLRTGSVVAAAWAVAMGAPTAIQAQSRFSRPLDAGAAPRSSTFSPGSTYSGSTFSGSTFSGSNNTNSNYPNSNYSNSTGTGSFSPGSFSPGAFSSGSLSSGNTGLLPNSRVSGSRVSSMKSPLSSFSGTTSSGSRIGRVSGTAPDDFADLIGQWLAIDEQLDVITQQARAATLRDQEVLRPRYLQLVNQAHELLPSLRMATLREYRDRPNQNPEVTMLMLGILAHRVRSDQIDEAMQVASMMLEAECDHLALPNLAGRAAYCAHDFDSAELLLTRAKELNAIEKVSEDYLRDVDVVRSRWNVELQVRQREERDDNLPRVLLETTKGNITLELFENEAPQTVGNFVHLVDSGFYNGLTFHRVVANFMGQSGCPKGDGYGGPGYSIMDEVGRVGHRNHFSGSLSMAKTKDPNSAGSQFFITFRPVPELDGKHTVFGRVIDGMPVLAELQRREANSRIEPDRILRAEVLRKQDHPYVPTKTRQGS